MADGVYAAVERVEPATLQAVADRTTSETELEELRPRHDPVLLLGERGDRPIRPTFGT
jgi:hypothetical protein